MKAVKYVTGAKYGSYDWKRVSGNGGYPFDAERYKKQRGQDTGVYNNGTQKPIVELVAAPISRWLLTHQWKTFVRYTENGDKVNTAPYLHSESVYLSGCTGAESLCAPKDLYGEFLKEREYQEFLNESPYDDVELALHAEEYPSAGSYASIEEALLGLQIWKSSWKRFTKDKYNNIYITTVPVSRAAQTLEDGLVFVKRKLNAILPEPAKTLLSVVIGLPQTNRNVYQDDVVAIVYPEMTMSVPVFDFSGGELVVPNGFGLPAIETKVAEGLVKGKWPDAYQRLLKVCKDDAIRGDYNLMVKLAKAEDEADRMTVAQLELVRSLLIEKQILDADVDYILAGIEDTVLNNRGLENGGELAPIMKRILTCGNENAVVAKYEAYIDHYFPKMLDVMSALGKEAAGKTDARFGELFAYYSTKLGTVDNNKDIEVLYDSFKEELGSDTVRKHFESLIDARRDQIIDKGVRGEDIAAFHEMTEGRDARTDNMIRLLENCAPFLKETETAAFSNAVGMKLTETVLGRLKNFVDNKSIASGEFIGWSKLIHDPRLAELLSKAYIIGDFDEKQSETALKYINSLCGEDAELNAVLDRYAVRANTPKPDKASLDAISRFISKGNARNPNWNDRVNELYFATARQQFESALTPRTTVKQIKELSATCLNRELFELAYSNGSVPSVCQNREYAVRLLGGDYSVKNINRVLGELENGNEYKALYRCLHKELAGHILNEAYPDVLQLALDAGGSEVDGLMMLFGKKGFEGDLQADVERAVGYYDAFRRHESLQTIRAIRVEEIMNDKVRTIFVNRMEKDLTGINADYDIKWALTALVAFGRAKADACEYYYDMAEHDDDNLFIVYSCHSIFTEEWNGRNEKFVDYVLSDRFPEVKKLMKQLNYLPHSEEEIRKWLTGKK